jgi:glycosyltransferase involved in cell wall biosynthesis
MSDIKKPWVSFCMSTFKRPVFLKDTLRAILRQRFTDFEIIVSDNDPERSAEAVVKEINDNRVHYFNNGDNLGMISSFNKSIERSCADFVVMITDDDPVYADLLETFYKLYTAHPGYGMYLGGCDWFCLDPEVAGLYKLKIGTNSCLSNDYAFNHTMSFTADDFLQSFFTFKLFPHYLWSTCMVSRDILLKMGGVPDYGTPFLGDYAYLGVLSSYSGCVVINKSLGCQTIHNQNFGRNQNEQIVVAAKEFPAFIEKHISHINSWPVVKQQMLRFTAMWLVSHIAFLYRYKGNAELKNVEKEVFEIGYMKKYKFKYFLKTRFPVLHDAIVNVKKKFKY